MTFPNPSCFAATHSVPDPQNGSKNVISESFVDDFGLANVAATVFTKALATSNRVPLL